MFERPIDYPCAVADQTPEGCVAALKWIAGHLNTGQQLTVWVPQKRTLTANDFLIRLAKIKDINIVTPYERFYGANGPVRNQLARLLIRGEQAFANVNTLSGGERFRVALACLLLKQPPYQLLLLDEPTNNLDLSTRHHLIQALNQYRGALIMVTHDSDFMNQLELIARYHLNPEKGLKWVEA